MPDSPQQDKQIERFFDSAIQTEKIAYEPVELLTCPGCKRQNPPNRTNCIYCGATLEIGTSQIAFGTLVWRTPEEWEHGFNVICRPDLKNENIAIERIIERFPIEQDHVRSIIDSNKPLPIARVESQQFAESISNELGLAGIGSLVVSDVDLGADLPPVRLSRIATSKTAFQFVNFNTRDIIEIAFEDLALIVTGQITQERTDVVAKRKRKSVQLLDEAASFFDETVLDLYPRNDGRGYRINVAGFDFTCLGAEMSYRSNENIARLADFMSRHAPNVRIVDDYALIKALISSVWEIESRSDAQGIKRLGFGRTGFGKARSTSNLKQFTKYSRLQWHLL